MKIDFTVDEAEALDLLLDEFFTHLSEHGVEPEEAFVSLAAKVGIARLAPT